MMGPFLSRGDATRMLFGLKPRKLEASMAERLGIEQQRLFVLGYRSVSLIGSIICVIIALIYFDVEREFDRMWALLAIIQVIHCFLVQALIFRRYKTRRGTMRFLAAVTAPSVLLSGLLAGMIPGLALHENDSEFMLLMAVMTTFMWTFFSPFWFPTLIQHFVFLAIGVFAGLVCSFNWYGLLEVSSVLAFMLPIVLPVLLLIIIMGNAYLQDRLRKITLMRYGETQALMLADFSDGAQDWLWRTDSELNLLEIPPEKLLDIPSDQQPFRLDTIFMPGQGEHGALLRLLEENQPLPDLKLRRHHNTPGAEPIWWRVRGNPMRDDEGKFLGYLLIGSDISAEMALGAERRARERLDAVLHVRTSIMFEINGAIGNFVQAGKRLQSLPYLDPSIRRMLDAAIETGTQATLLSNDLAGFGKTNSGEEPEPVNIGWVCEELAKELSNRYKNKITLNYDGLADAVVLVDRRAFLSALTHLFENAATAMGGRGNIHMLVTRQVTEDHSRMISIRVEDEGPGLPPELADKLFEPFVTSRSEEGRTGIGLSIVRRFTERASGAVIASNSSRGAVFEMLLPEPDAAEISGEANSQNKAIMPVSSLSDGDISDEEGTLILPREVIILEDDAVFAQMIGIILDQVGYSYRRFESVEELVDRLPFEDFIPHAIIADLHLSGGSPDGPIAVRKLLEAYPNQAIAVLYISGLVGRFPKEFHSGETEPCFLTKPFAADELIDALKREITYSQEKAA